MLAGRRTPPSDPQVTHRVCQLQAHVLVADDEGRRNLHGQHTPLGVPWIGVPAPRHAATQAYAQGVVSNRNHVGGWMSAVARITIKNLVGPKVTSC